MATKLQLITALTEQTAEQLTGKRGYWEQYLATAARLYKYSFPDQLLIYAQRPNSTACASIELWNSKMKRWVNKGAKGIALIDDSGDKLRLKYVFDVSDTHGNYRDSIYPYVWQMKEEYKEQVLEALSHAFGEPDEKAATFADKLISITANAVADNQGDYYDELMNVRDGSFLEELDAFNVESGFRNALKAGVAYSVLTRCGIEARTYFTDEDFSGVYNFNTFDTAIQLGSAASDISGMVLRQIERTVKDIERQKRLEKFAIIKNIGDNDDGKETKERVDEHEHKYDGGTDLHSGGRLSDTRSDTARAGGQEHRQIRDAEENLSQKSQDGNVQQPPAFRQTDKPPAGDRWDGAGEAEHDDARPYEKRPAARQGDRPDGLDGAHEQPQASDRRTDTGGTGLQLTLFPTEEKQKERIAKAEEDKSSAFSMPLNTLEQQENESPPDGYAYKQGDKVYLEGDRPFEIENIGMFDVHLRDLVFPILSRAVPVKEFERLLIDNPLNAHLPAKEVSALDEQAGELLAETEMDVGTEPFKEAPDKPEATAETSQTPEISVAQPVPNHVPINYRITDDDLGAGGAKTKYGFNVAAIRTLQGLESENRMATADDQETLAKYVGWGGISQAFDKDNTSWTKEYTELKGLLSESEYASARQSTLNAHYTSPTVIKAIYTAIENMGFQTGNILEPAMGVGNFFGLVPQSMAKSKLYGVELDSITGRIAKQLYQSARISVQGFENTDLPDSFFDLAIGNVPFGQYRLADKTYDKYNFLIHDYFLAKTLDKVRPSGIIAFITSKGTMDKQSPEVRKYIARRAELIGAVRLPNNAFLSNAETDVTADIIFLQKRDRIIDVEPEWVQLSKTEDGIPINSYYATNPDMVLGKMVYDKSMYGDEKETSCHPFPDAEFAEQLHEAIENIHAEFPDIEPMEELEQEDASIPADPGVRNFSFTLADGQIYYRENSRMNRVEISKTAENRIRGMIEIRDCTRRLITLQTEDYHDSAIKTEQEKLNALYDSFTKQYGLLNSRGNSMAFSDDASYALLCSLEVINENGELERKADMFSKRTIRRHPDLAAIDTASEALALSLSEKACVDMAYMNGLTSLSEEEIARDLRGVIFLNPLLNDERRLQGLTYAGK